MRSLSSDQTPFSRTSTESAARPSALGLLSAVVLEDYYGRNLRAIERKLPNGSTQSIAGDLRAVGLVHRYVGLKTGWC